MSKIEKKIGNVMIDLETLGTKPGYAIIAIGAVVFSSPCLKGFNTNDCYFYSNISMDSNYEYDLKSDPATIEWWGKQSKEAKQGSLYGTDELRVTLRKFSSFIAQMGVEVEVRVWGNAASFDLKILEAAYEACALPVPWKYYNEMCFRTLKNLPHRVPAPTFFGTKHNALADAKHQALWAEEILHKIDCTECEMIKDV